MVSVKNKMKAYNIGNLIIGFLLWGAVLFHFINMKTFFMAIFSFMFLKSCIYFDTRKKASEDLFDYYFTLLTGVVFLFMLVFLLFFKK